MTNNVTRGFECEIKKVEPEKRDDAVGLIFDVFMEFEAPDYLSEGVETFKNTALFNEKFLDTLEMYGAYIGERLIGIIATRNLGNHIAMFFVNKNYHRQGVGKKLFQVVAENSTANEIKVNSLPYAVAVHHCLGFADTDIEQIVNGLKFTPMKFTKCKESEVTDN
ncbi:MAG: GNAT family N-acetyltransferase [Anaerolineaceae bacterium]|nr:GNAT family N-acetyltransferase [Anaerolineaceae bacterium]